MINSALIDPKSIAIIGGSQNTGKPGGKIIENLLQSSFSGELYVVNPKSDVVQGLKSYHSIAEVPEVDLAILAIPAKFCPGTIEELCAKGTRAFIVISAGFGELDEEGKGYDLEILKSLKKYNACLLGPNCIGMIHENHHSVFTTPVPAIHRDGVEFISSSGSTAVFIVEAGMEIGLRFSNIYTVGNALQIKVEDFIEYLDVNFDPEKSSKVIMIYIENIGDPQRFIKHARSLRSKGTSIIALKAGMTDAGSRAASSHTGAMASPTVAVEAMFRKAGVISCVSRQELLYAAGILLTGLPKAGNMAVVTHAGGAGVMLTDALERGGMKVPEIGGKDADELLDLLFTGSSIKNPIDFLATGTAEQLALITDYCDQKFDHIDAISVIFGSPGLFDVTEVYKVLRHKIKNTDKPIYPILPSPVNTKEAIQEFIKSGNHFFPDESIFGQVISKLMSEPRFFAEGDKEMEMDIKTIRKVIDHAKEGYLPPDQVAELLMAANIPVIQEKYAKTVVELHDELSGFSFPIVMKVVGPVHKSDQGGVLINIEDIMEAEIGFQKLMGIPDATAVLIQPMLKGQELFIGAKREDGFGHLILFGMGGIFFRYQTTQAMSEK